MNPMSRNLEAVWLPLTFLTVALLGGMRIADRIVLVPPPLFTLVLATLLVGVLVKCGALAPQRLMNGSRSALQNLSGAVVLATCFGAAMQAFNVAMPEFGAPRVLFSVLLLVLLLNTWAASPDRVRLLRSLAVIFGAAFTLKFVVLAALADPEGSRFKRFVVMLFEGLTLGSFSQEPFHPATGYIAFFTLVLFVGGLALLPGRPRLALPPPTYTPGRELGPGA